MPPDLPAARFYRERAALHARTHADAERRARALSWARLATFALLALAAAAALAGVGRAPWLAAAGALSAFVALVVMHRRAEANRSWHRAHERVSADAERRVLRDWDALPPDREPAPAGHAYAEDLGLFGRGSLSQLLGAVSDYPGRHVLRRWLLAPAPPAQVRERQAAVAELAPMVELREALAARAMLAGVVRRADVERFLQWAEGAPWLLDRPALLWLARAVTALTLGALALRAAAPDAAARWGLPWPALAASALMAATLGRRAAASAGAATAFPAALAQHTELFAAVAAAPAASPFLRRVRGEVEGAAVALRRLDLLVRLAEVRHSPMAYVLLQTVGLWDVHVTAALERWRRRDGGRLRAWLDALGQAEAAAALAGLAHDNPSWAFPSLDESGPPGLDARALGHPLIREDRRVPNDVAVGPPGTFEMVSGSNMSGKSTLLRAVGLNAVLAQAGAPACAAGMRLTPLAVHTSMLVHDALDEGVSLFLAELRRLKLVVDAARAAAPPAPAVLYLLDEILHGTNTAERQVAARRIVGHLLAHHAVGMVSTHDLALADDAGPLARAARAVHFSETIKADGGMTFDYRLRPGIATSVNALRLVRMVGLD